jgi:chemotaxis protein methyltransferase CheR
MDETEKSQNEKVEIDLVLQAVYMKYGYDFRHYAKASIRRRIRHSMEKHGLERICDLQHRLIYDGTFFDQFLLDLTVNVTEMFRDPPFFKALREKILPALRDSPPVKIWHAGCATGEEAYSIAILLQEAGMADMARIYATVANEAVLARAKKGIYSLERIQQYTTNYQKSGGLGSFADYYTSRYGNAIMNQDLRKRIVFSDHNLVTDEVFGDMDLILCRNVMIYFSRPLQDRVFGIFTKSLCAGGFLCLGTKESVRFSPVSDEYETVMKGQKIYRKRPDARHPDECIK